LISGSPVCWNSRPEQLVFTLKSPAGSFRKPIERPAIEAPVLLVAPVGKKSVVSSVPLFAGIGEPMAT
jgi:hypothetical protein